MVHVGKINNSAFDDREVCKGIHSRLSGWSGSGGIGLASVSGVHGVVDISKRRLSGLGFSIRVREVAVGVLLRHVLRKIQKIIKARTGTDRVVMVVKSAM